MEQPVSTREAYTGGNVQPVEGRDVPRVVAVLRRFEATTAVWVFVAFVLFVLILNPLYHLVLESFQLTRGQGVEWTLRNYIKAFTEPLYRGPVLWTFIVSAAVGPLSLMVGAAVAWCVGRTDMPLPGFIRTSVLLSFVTPPFLGAIAWIFLAGPREGWLNIIYRGITGAAGHEYLFNIFTMPGVVFTMALFTFPQVFIVVLAALNNIPSDVEDAASIAGGNSLSTMVNITLPLVLPALMAGLLLAVLEAMTLLGIPAVLAIPARQHLMTTQIRAIMDEGIDAVGLAAAYSFPILVAAALLVWMQRAALGRRGYATVGGKGGHRRPQKLGVWRYPVFAMCMVPVTCAIVLPYFALIATSFMKNLGHGLTWSNMTLENYRSIFQSRAIASSMVNTLLLATMAATGATLLASVIAYISQRQLVHGHRHLGLLATLPLGIPGIVLGVGFFAAYTKAPFVLYGTLWILFLAYVTKFLPLAYQASNAALMSIHPELEESGRILGANRLTVFKDVTVPLFKVGLLASWLLVFMPSLRELSTSALIWTIDTKVISVVILNLYDEARLADIAALGVILMIVTLAVVVCVFRMMGRDFMRA